MRIAKKNHTGILLFLIFVLFSCKSPRKVGIWGFAFYGDRVIVTGNPDTLLNITVDSTMYQPKVCYFKRQLKLPANSKGDLRIEIDSSRIKVLDTVVSVPGNFKEPFILVKDPTFNGPMGRAVFVRDAADSNFMKM